MPWLILKLSRGAFLGAIREGLGKSVERQKKVDTGQQEKAKSLPINCLEGLDLHLALRCKFRAPYAAAQYRAKPR